MSAPLRPGQRADVCLRGLTVREVTAEHITFDSWGAPFVISRTNPDVTIEPATPVLPTEPGTTFRALVIHPRCDRPGDYRGHVFVHQTTRGIAYLLATGSIVEPEDLADGSAIITPLDEAPALDTVAEQEPGPYDVDLDALAAIIGGVESIRYELSTMPDQIPALLQLRLIGVADALAKSLRLLAPRVGDRS